MNGQPRLSERDDLEREVSSPTKHEFIAGELFAMAGGTLEHGAFGSGQRSRANAA